MTKEYTDLEMEAALCAWEALAEWIHDKENRPDWNRLKDNVGTAEIRSRVPEIARFVLRVYDIATDKQPDCFDGHSYDWEVVPAILSHVTPLQYELAFPDAEETADKVAKYLGLEEFTSLARHHADRLWAYRDLISDHEDDVLPAFLLGEKPEDFAKRLGEKHGLISVDEWRGYA